jgi:DNA invertase Pin-like site-specific DNA recombinase
VRHRNYERVGVYLRYGPRAAYPTLADSQFHTTNEFVDFGSGASLGRPGLAHAIAAAGAGRIDVLFVADIDRLSRKPHDANALIRHLNQVGVLFCVADPTIATYETPAGRS